MAAGFYEFVSVGLFLLLTAAALWIRPVSRRPVRVPVFRHPRPGAARQRR
jgi:hypothetical protein